MSQLNKRTRAPTTHTHEGGRAKRITPLQELRRTVMTCLLWEDTFYEGGKSVAARISELCQQVSPEEIAAIAVQARSEYRLRHAPLLLAYELTLMSDRLPQNRRNIIASTIEAVIQRADELSEFVAIYFKDGKRPLSGQAKKGLRRAFEKFNEYHLAKYDRARDVRLRDVAFLAHVKAGADVRRGRTIASLVNKSFTPKRTRSSGFPVLDAYGLKQKSLPLAVPDTWETELSAGKDKRATFERLLRENKLPYMALLRNLRNMQQAEVATGLVFAALRAGAATSKALPFRYVAAARAVPAWMPVIEEAMLMALDGRARLPGKTVLLVDVSGSMDDPLSEKSDLSRLDAASALAILLAGVCDEFHVYTFSHNLVQVPSYRGFALEKAISDSQPHGSTYLGRAVEGLEAKVGYDRLVVITDEQSSDRVPDPSGRAYLVNVASNQRGVGYGGAWIHVDGFSEAVVDWIQRSELEEVGDGR